MNRWSFWRFVAIILATSVGCEKATPLQKPPPPVVSVALPIERDVVEYEDFIGRTDAVSKVDIRARVSGYLVKVNFKDGDIVKKGTLLYEIDPRPFQADLDQANGEVERLEAEKKLMDIQVERYRKLAEKGAGSQQDLDQYLAKQAENIGALKAAQAQVERAQLKLDYARITAPIDGKLSRTLLTLGNLVNADTTLLTTIMSIDPMYAYFSVEEPTLLEFRAMIRDGTIPVADVAKVRVRMGLADDVKRKFPLEGMLDFTNNTVDPLTGTILVRGVFANPYQMPEKPPMLLPGLFVRVRLEAGPPQKTLLINQRAIGTDQGDKYVYVVGKNNKVAYKRIELGMIFDDLQSIKKGLEPKDRVVVSGLQRIRPDVEVKAEEVPMDKVGVTQSNRKSGDAKPNATKSGGTPPKSK